MKCKYSKCLCSDSDDIINSYHTKCLKTKNDISEIKRLFTDNINRNVVFSQLVKVINNIIFNKRIDSEYLKFGLQYYITNKIPLNYPQGLYYVIQNKEVEKAYSKRIATSVKKEIKSLSDSTLDTEQTFEHRVFKKKSIGDIFDE